MKDCPKNFSRTRIPATSEGVDENCKSYQEMVVTLRSPNKPATKNFMSPTISATSKANPPRKSVLVERNQITDSPLHKSPNLDSKFIQKVPDLDSRASSVISSIGSAEIGNNDSDFQPYDPLTNYLSPRPEFLRYKPNRLREIILRMENGDVGGSDESSVSSEAKEMSNDETDSLHDSEAGSLKKENEEIEFTDEEFEEEEEEGVKEGKTSFLKSLLLLIVLVFSTSYICSMNSHTPSSSTQDTQAIQNWPHRDLIGLNHTVIGHGILAEELAEDIIWGVVDEWSETEKVQTGKFEVIEVVKDEQVEENPGLVCEDGTCVLKMNNTLETFDVKSENARIAENIEVLEVYDHQIEGSDSSIGPKIDVKDENTEVALVFAELVENTVKEFEHEELNQEGNDMQSIENLNCELEDIIGEEEEAMDGMDTESISRSIICVALISVVSASLTLRFCLKKARKVRQSSPPVFVPSIEHVVAEKFYVDKEQKQRDSVDSYASRLHSVIDLRNDVSENSYQTQAPLIELLSEFEVGCSVSNSLKSDRTKSRMINNEVRSNYFHQEKELGSTADSAQQEESSAMNSASYGRTYTAEKKTLLRRQKLEGGDDEHKKRLFTTPVRRSTRIRNRAITSP